MTRKITRARPPRQSPSDSHLYLPHSSWTRIERKPAVSPPIAPDDFWARLGL